MHEKMNQLFEDAKEVDKHITRVDEETVSFQTENGQTNVFQLDQTKTNHMKELFPRYDVCWINGKNEDSSRYWLYMREDQGGTLVEIMFAYVISKKRIGAKYAHRKIGEEYNPSLTPNLTNFYDIEREFKKTVENLPENRLYFVTGVM